MNGDAQPNAVPRKHLAPCTVPGCPTLTRQSRCPEHAREADRKRGTAAQRGYGSEWRKIRKNYLARFPFCQDPEGCIERATDVHHIDGGGPLGDNSDENLEALCHAHHSRRTIREQPGGFVRPE